MSGAAQQGLAGGPACEERPHVEVYHGVEHPDPFRWLREKESEAVRRHLEAENGHADAIMERTKGLQETLYAEFVGRLKEDDETAGFTRGPYEYFERTEKGKQYAVHCRRDGEGREQVLLDLNAMGLEFADLGAVRISPDNAWMAYSLDTTGDEVHDIRVKNLATGALLPKAVSGASYALEWGGDSATLYYDSLDEIHRPFRIHRASIHQEHAAPELVFEEGDLKFEVALSKSLSGRFLFIKSESFLSTELRAIDAADPAAPARVVHPRRTGVTYDVEHVGGDLILRSDADGCDNFRLLALPIDELGSGNLREILPYEEGVFIEKVLPFKDYLVLLQRSQGAERFRVYPLKGGREVIDPQDYEDIVFDEEVYGIGAEEEQYHEKNILRFWFSSFVTPKQVIEYDLAKKERTVKKQKEVPGYQPENYVSKRLFAKAEDGTQVPISVVHRRDLSLSEPHATLLKGYGSYGISIDPTFSSERISFLDRGMVYAIGHIRGGGENGRLWYKNGKFLKKKNTFTDFVACARELMRQGLTSPAHLAIEGRSAGGLLIGSTLNLAPALFKAALLGVPFVDVVNTMMDPSIPLTVNEYEEWGNPNEKEFFDAMKSYSPYDNLVSSPSFPHLLVRAGLNDPRVQYWEPAKYVAKLRKLRHPENKRAVLLKTEMGAGHFGVTGRYSYLKEIAYDYAFIIHFLLNED